MGQDTSTDETLPSSAFPWNEQADEYRCPQGNVLRREWRVFQNRRTHITKADTIIYRDLHAEALHIGMVVRLLGHDYHFSRAREVYGAQMTDL